MKLLLMVLALSVLSGKAHADREWETIQVPGTYCGNGESYKIFLSKRSSEHLSLVFQGGGTCWDALTCGTNVTTKLQTPKIRTKHGILREDSPLADSTMVYFPYCTGDMFAGTHTAYYPPLLQTYHVGRNNIYKSLDWLTGEGKISFEKTDRISLYGYSAGALGLALNLVELDERYFLPRHEKFATLDGIGLHWNEHVFKRFSTQMKNDFARGLNDLGIMFDENDGFLSPHVPDVCARFPDWQVGILQGSMDFVMAVAFGMMNPLTHRQKVYGEKGIYEITSDPHDNCQAWVPDTFNHTFLDGSSPTKAYRRRVQGVSALDFMHSLYAKRRFRPSYK